MSYYFNLLPSKIDINEVVKNIFENVRTKSRWSVSSECHDHAQSAFHFYSCVYSSAHHVRMKITLDDSLPILKQCFSY